MQTELTCEYTIDQEGGNSMSIGENKAIIRRLLEELNKGNLVVVDELYDVNFVGHQLGGLEVRGRERWKQIIAMLLSAFPYYHEAIEDIHSSSTASCSSVHVKASPYSVLRCF